MSAPQRRPVAVPHQGGGAAASKPAAPRQAAPGAGFPIDAPTIRVGALVFCRQCRQAVRIDEMDFVWVHVNVYDAYRPTIHTAEV